MVSLFAFNDGFWSPFPAIVSSISVSSCARMFCKQFVEQDGCHCDTPQKPFHLETPCCCLGIMCSHVSGEVLGRRWQHLVWIVCEMTIWQTRVKCGERTKLWALFFPGSSVKSGLFFYTCARFCYQFTYPINQCKCIICVDKTAFLQNIKNSVLHSIYTHSVPSEPVTLHLFLTVAI